MKYIKINVDTGYEDERLLYVLVTDGSSLQELLDNAYIEEQDPDGEV